MTSDHLSFLLGLLDSETDAGVVMTLLNALEPFVGRPEVLARVVPLATDKYRQDIRQKVLGFAQGRETTPAALDIVEGILTSPPDNDSQERAASVVLANLDNSERARRYLVEFLGRITDPPLRLRIEEEIVGRAIRGDAATNEMLVAEATHPDSNRRARAVRLVGQAATKTAVSGQGRPAAEAGVWIVESEADRRRGSELLAALLRILKVIEETAADAGSRELATIAITLVEQIQIDIETGFPSLQAAEIAKGRASKRFAQLRGILGSAILLTSALHVPVDISESASWYSDALHTAGREAIACFEPTLGDEAAPALPLK